MTVLLHSKTVGGVKPHKIPTFTQCCFQIITSYLSETLFPPDWAPVVEFDWKQAGVVQRSQEEVKSLRPLALTCRGLQHPSLLLHHHSPPLEHLHFDKKRFWGGNKSTVTHEPHRTDRSSHQCSDHIQWHLPWVIGEEDAGRFWAERTWSWMRPFTGWKQVVRCSSEWHTWKRTLNFALWLDD